MPNLASLYNELATSGMPPEETPKELSSDPGLDQLRQSWLASTITQEKRKLIEENIYSLLTQSMDMAISPNADPVFIVKLLIKAHTYRTILNTYYA